MDPTAYLVGSALGIEGQMPSPYGGWGLNPNYLIKGAEADWRKFKHWVVPDPRRDREVMTTGPTTARRIIYGRVKVGGQLVYAETSGTNNETLHLVIVLAGHVCDAIEEIYLDDKLITDPAFADKVTYAAYDGTQTTADADLVAISDLWTEDHIGYGCSYLRVSITWADGLFLSGIPTITAIVRGKKLYDPRDGTTVFSSNTALAVFDYMRLSSALGGMGCLPDEVDVNLIAAAADICDQLVAKDDVGGTEPRYTCNGVVDLAVTPGDVLMTMLSAMDGVPIYTCGVWSIYAGARPALGPEIDATWLRGDISFSAGSSKSQRINTVKTVFVDAANKFAASDTAVVTNDSYLVEDGEELVANLNLPFTTSAATAQRLARIAMEKSRAGATVSFPGNMKPIDVAPNDLIPLTIPGLGWESKEFRVLDVGFSLGGVDLSLGEERAGLYDWTSSSVQVVGPSGDVTVGQVPGGTAGSDLSSGVTIDTGGLDVSGTSALKSGNYVAGATGWKLDGAGASELNDPTVNGKALTGEVAEIADIEEAIMAHESLLDPHPQYTTEAEAEGIAAAEAAGTMAAHVAAGDPHPQYTTPAEAAAAAPVQSVAGRTGNVTLAQADVAGLTTADNPIFAGAAFTSVGGTAYKVKNKTGAASVIGHAVTPSRTTDRAVQHPDDIYDTIGFIANAGVADGSDVWVTKSGYALAMLRDGVGCKRGNILVGDPTDPKRSVPVSRFDSGLPAWAPHTLTINTGTLAGGTVADLVDVDASVVQVNEVTGIPGFDVVLDFVAYLQPGQFHLHGYYDGILGHTVEAQAWNYNTSSYDTIGTLPDETAEQVYTFDLAADHWDGTNVKVRIYHVTTGNATHHLYLNRAVLFGDDTTHMAERGHADEEVAAGTDMLVRVSVHFN